MRKEIRIAGFGGQGIILAGIVIGKAAALHDGIHAVQTQSYGPEARGGASRTEIVISDEEIDYPKVQSPDILAAQFILIAVIFDSVDGWVARKTNRDDKFGFGKNIDSLCDIISFGVAPGILLYFATLTNDIRYINIIVSLLIVICGILRLSRFNVISNMRTIQDKFVGLPIPATALLLSSFYLSGLFTTETGLLIMTLSSVLMISTLEYFKPKSVKTALIILILIISVCMPQNIQIMLMNIPAKVLFIISLIYILF